MSRILVISPCPTHPCIGGNIRRIFNLVECLQQLGHPTHLLYVPHFMFSVPNIRAMRQHWKEVLHVGRPHLALLPDFLRRALLTQGERLLRRRRSESAGKGADGLADWDRWVRQEWRDETERLYAIHRFDVVIVEYVVLSSVLQRIPNSVLKIIDTHDCFSGLAERPF